MLIPGMEEQLNKIPGFCENEKGIVPCNILVGYKAVYRLCFGLAMFYLLLSLLMIKVKSSSDPRAAVHNGFWFFKFAAAIAIIIGAFFIPEGTFTTGNKSFLNCVMLMFCKETDITVTWDCNITCFVLFFNRSWQNHGICVKYFPFHVLYEDEVIKSDPATKKHLYVFFLSFSVVLCRHGRCLLLHPHTASLTY